MIGAIVAVTLAVWLFLAGRPDALVLSVVLGVLAASTAPAATVAVIHEYRSKGPVTTTLLGIVAMDDAIGIILFSMMLVWVAGTTMMGAVTGIVVEIGGALVVGAALGWALAYFGHRVRNPQFFLPMVLSAILLSQGLAEYWHLSPLLTAMTVGFTARATYRSGGDRLMAPIEYLEELVILVFFTLAGAHFQLDVFVSAFDLAIVYVVARAAGKIIGTYIAARLISAPEAIRRYIGFGVLPQAGIAIGLALSLLTHADFKDTGLLLVNVILASTLVNELIGPFATRYALFKAGELNQGEKG